MSDDIINVDNHFTYRGYFLIDFSNENWVMPPRVLIFDGYGTELPIHRVSTMKEATQWIDRIIHGEAFNERFEDFLNDEEPADDQ